MAKVSPISLFPSYRLLDSGVAVTPTEDMVAIALSDLPALDVTEADPVDGNGCEVVRSIGQATFESIKALPAADKPTKFSIAKGVPVPITTIDPNIGDYEYQQDIILTTTYPAGATDAALSPEPVA